MSLTESATPNSHLLLHPDVNLRPIHHQVIALLVQGLNLSAAAERCGLHRSTVYHWKRTLPDFSDALRDAQEERARHYRQQSEQHADAALHAVRQMIDNPQTPATVRLKAALHILGQVTELPAAPTQAEVEAAARQRQDWQKGLTPRPVPPPEVVAQMAHNDPERTRELQEQLTADYKVKINLARQHQEDWFDYADRCEALAEENAQRNSTLFDTSTPLSQPVESKPQAA